uniref:I/LWEQ domain-containing protein n=1 Tax=Laticauda laticaudata TaxID=8630 RepID=A0A8C5RJH5_LATLA
MTEGTQEEGGNMTSVAQRYITQLKAQVNSLEAEVEDQRMQKQKALVDNEQLRDELEKLQKAKFEGDKNRGLYLEAEKKASTTEIRYAKLKEKHNELINTHAELLRKNADTAKQLTVTQQSQEEVARVKEELAFQMEQAKRESEMKLEDQMLQVEQMKRQLDSKAGELTQLQQSLSHSKQVGSDLNSQLDALQAEKETLRKLGLIQEKELLLSQETEKRAKKKTHEQHLQQKLLDDQFRILQGTIKEAESIIQDAVSKLDDPLHIRCTSSPDYLVSRTQAALESVNALEKGHKHYLTNMADATGLVAALAQFAHLMADAIVNGSATSHLAPTDHADKLTESCRDCGHHSLDYLNKLKDKQSLREADPADLRTTLQRLFQLGQELRPKSLDIREEELGDLVDKEMATTSAAVEDAVRRIEEMMNQARVESSGVKLEGAATPQEFYAKNSCWTEGLISASKAVGWGATQLVESADKVVLHTGKYEELIVCSHEIAASTAQLVAASKVKAEKHSKNLGKLQECSRTVNEKAANVVASTKSGQEQVEEKDTMDFSGLSLIKLKKEEMETQVKVLELEKTLENERLRLGELRRQHYALAGLYTENMDGKKPTIAPIGLLFFPFWLPIFSPLFFQLAQDGVYQAHVVNF